MKAPRLPPLTSALRWPWAQACPPAPHAQSLLELYEAARSL
jgi:hypothetical protein